MQRSYRTCLRSYVALTICIGWLPAVTLPSALQGDRDAAELAAVGIASLLFVYFWLSRFKLTIAPDTLIYASLFTGERRINIAEITHSEMVYQGGSYRRYLLAVTAHGVTTRINFKVFSREAASALFKLLGLTNRWSQRLTGAKLNS
jgi:hypothetical protein